MKKLLALLLALVMILTIFAACGEKKETAGNEDAGNGTGSEGTPAEGQQGTASEPAKEPEKVVDPRWADEVITPETNAVIVTAMAYYYHKMYIQYDQLNMERVDRTAPRYDFAIPEEASPQHWLYFECGVFARNVYNTVFDYMTPKAGEVLADNYYNKCGERVWRWAGETDKETAKDELMKNLQPGDIIYYSYTSNNHIMLYIGEGNIIHCSYASGGGDYDYSALTDKTESSALFLTTVDKILQSRDLFAAGNKVCILRPVLLGLEVNDETKIRVEKLSDVAINKLTTAPRGHSVNPGDEVTFTIQIRNVGDAEKTVTVTDAAPEYTKAVDASELKWTVTIPKGETQTIKYTLKVDADCPLKTTIDCNNTKVEGMTINNTPIYVDKTLTADQQSKITALDVSKITASSYQEMVEQIYKQALGVDVGDFTPATVLGDFFKKFPSMKTLTVSPNPVEGSLSEQVFVPLFYGGQNCKSRTYWERTKNVEKINLIPGDVFICSTKGTEDTCWAYVYLGNGKVAVYNNGKVQEALGDTYFVKMLGQHCFMLARPSFSF